MRKILMGFAALSLLFGASSCVDETRETVNDGKGDIKFKTALGKQTVSRASEFIYWDDTDHTNLDVYAYPAGVDTEFREFNLTYVSGGNNDGGYWTYTNPVNQPGSVLRYYSVYPETNIEWLDEDNKTTGFTYAVLTNDDDEDGDLQEDLIAAYTSTNSPEVELRFDHLLTQVNFAVQGMWGTKIVIEDLFINDVLYTGDYSFATKAWTLDADPVSYEYFADADQLNLLQTGTQSTPVYLGNGGGTYDFTNALMLMPQEFGATSESSLSFTFSLWGDIDGIDGDDDGGTDDDGDLLDDMQTKTVEVPITAMLNNFETVKWEAGKRYVYLIDFSSYLENEEIVFKVYVNEWVDDADNTINETLHVPDATRESIENAIAKHAAANVGNGNLKTFPISVAYDLTDANPVTLTYITGFDQTDKIRIQFPNSTSAAFFAVEVVGWQVTPDATDDRVVILEWDETNDMAVGKGNVRAASNNSVDIEAAAENIRTRAVVYDLFSVTVPDPIDDDNIPYIYNVKGFANGDRIRFVFFDNAGATDAVIAIPGWSLVGIYDNVVLIECDDADAFAAAVAASVPVTGLTAESTPTEFAAAMLAAIETQQTAAGSGTVNMFPITLGTAATVDMDLISNTFTFAVNGADLIIIDCPDAATAAHFRATNLYSLGSKNYGARLVLGYANAS